MQSQRVSAMSRLPFESKTMPRGDASCAAVAGPPSLGGSRSGSSAREGRDAPIRRHTIDPARSGIGEIEISGGVLRHAAENIDLQIAGQGAVRRGGVLGFAAANQCEERAVGFDALY